MGDLMELRHDHHGCRLCVRQRAGAADEIERLQLSLAQVRAEQVRLMRWKRRWDEHAKILEDPENTFQDADGVLEVMDAMESGVNPDD